MDAFGPYLDNAHSRVVAAFFLSLTELMILQPYCPLMHHFAWVNPAFCFTCRLSFSESTRLSIFRGGRKKMASPAAASKSGRSQTVFLSEVWLSIFGGKAGDWKVLLWKINTFLATFLWATKHCVLRGRKQGREEKKKNKKENSKKNSALLTPLSPLESKSQLVKRTLFLSDASESSILSAR